MSESLTVIHGHFYANSHNFNGEYSTEELKHFIGIPFSDQNESVQEACEHNSIGIDRVLRSSRERINAEKSKFICFVMKFRPEVTIICRRNMKKEALLFAEKRHPKGERNFWFYTSLGKEVIVFRSGKNEESIMRHVFLMKPLKKF